MNTQQQNIFYKRVGDYITKAANHQNLTPSQIATRAEIQYNTVIAAMEGKRFSFHQLCWMIDVLKIDLNSMIKDIRKEGDNHGNKEKEISLENFI